MNSIAENIRAIRGRMAAAAEAAGRDPGEILLVGASKMNGAEACRAAIAGGVDALGENRVQEMTEKLARNAYEGAPLHFIGHLRQAERRELTQEVLLEVNVGGEESKSGFAPEAVYEAAERAKALENIRVRGLMTIPPIQREPHGNLPFFAKIARLYVDISRNLYDNEFTYLSMGMSDDFEDAIAAGATVVRVGSAIFGHRQYH